MAAPKGPLSDEEKKRRLDDSKVGLSGKTRKQQREQMRKYRFKMVNQMKEASTAVFSPWVTRDELMQLISNRLRDGKGSIHDFRTLAELYSSMQGWAYPTLSDQAKRLLSWVKEKKESSTSNEEIVAKRMQAQTASLDPFDQVRDLESLTDDDEDAT